MNLDHDFLQMRKLSEDEKKKVFTKNGTIFFSRIQVKQKKVFTKDGTFFSPNSSEDLRSDAHQCQIIGGMQM